MRFEDYDTLFRRALAAPDAVPHGFQRRFAVSPEPFDIIRAPTGSGKTEAILLGWIYRRFGPDEAVRQATPRRLVYCLPMRTLVEQTHDRAVRYLANLGLLAGRAECEPADRSKLIRYTPAPPTDAPPGTVAVHLLLGGNADDDWTLTPERDAILVGTQDMLLSRALNRGYARSRFQWPIDFGLLNNDCLWVFDELQLMGSGVSTSAQLAALRDRLTTFGPTRSVWMSATMDRSWLRTIDLRERVDFLAELTLTEEELTAGELGRRMTARKTLRASGIRSTDKGSAKATAEFVKGKHHAGTLTLVVLNTVSRAKDVFVELGKAFRKVESRPEVLLIHSRFRPAERAILNDALRQKTLPPGGRIVVATQVIEAGVDLSARVLVTELAPWSSVIQRLGRCHRSGEPGWDGEAYWLDVDGEKAAPYQSDDLAAARQYLTALDGSDVSPKALADFRYGGQPVELPFEHVHVVRRRDLLDLFDTAPDLSGNDIDVSRFVRGEAFRAAAMSRFDAWCRTQIPTHVERFRRHDQPDRYASPLLSGKDASGQYLAGHRHAYYLASDEDRDGYLDHLTVYAAGGLGKDEVAALQRLQKLSGGLEEPLRLLLVGLGQPQDFTAPPLRSSSCWVSETPFLVTRHVKRRGRRKDPPELWHASRSPEFARLVLEEELARLRLRRPEVPLPESVVLLDGNRMSALHLPPLSLWRFREKAEDDGGNRAAGAFRIVVPSPVAGPICLGHSSHFGLGLFLPESAPQPAHAPSPSCS